jgi:hypothetical protein
MIINSQPNNWQNVYNELVFGLESTNASAAGFQFLVDINVSGQTNPVARLTYPKQPGINTVDVDVSEVLRNYVTYDFQSYNSSGIKHCTNSKVDYWVEFGEVRNNASGVPVIYPNLANYYSSGSNAHSTNAVFDFLDWSKTAFIDYNVNYPIESGLTLNQTTYQERLRHGEERFLTYFDFNEFDGTGVVGNLNTQILDKNLNVLLESNLGFTPIGSINSINVANSGNASGISKTVYDAAFTNASAVYYRVNGQNEYNNYLTSSTNLTNAAWGKDAGVTFTHYANGGFANQPYDNYTNNSNTGGLRVYQELASPPRPFPSATYSVYLKGNGNVSIGIFQNPTTPQINIQLTPDWKLYQITRTDLIDGYMFPAIYFYSTSINCDICLSNFGDTPTTYFSRTFVIDKTCQKYNPIRLHYLNNLGGFDAFTFTKVSRNFTDIERKMFKKFQPLNYPKTFRAKTNYYTKFTDTIQVNSDGLTDAEWIGLKELVLSPIVMMEYGATYIPVNIIETNYEEKQYVNDRQISSLSLTLEYTFDNYRQSL